MARRVGATDRWRLRELAAPLHFLSRIYGAALKQDYYNLYRAATVKYHHDLLRFNVVKKRTKQLCCAQLKHGLITQRLDVFVFYSCKNLIENLKKIGCILYILLYVYIINPLSAKG